MSNIVDIKTATVDAKIKAKKAASLKKLEEYVKNLPTDCKSFCISVVNANNTYTLTYYYDKIDDFYVSSKIFEREIEKLVFKGKGYNR